MKYNTEVINEIAFALAEMLKSAVLAQQKSENGAVKIAEIETGIREVLREIGNQALSNLLSSLHPTPVAEIKCECGGLLHFQRIREAAVISVFGKTTYKRAYYAGCMCKKGKAPLDEEFGLEPGAVTAGLATVWV